MSNQKHGFSEEALRGLEDLDRRIPAWAETRSLQPGEFATRGGGPSPHYVGHRQRLRTRFLSGGHAAMPEYELLELLLCNAIERIDVKPLAKKLLETFGDLNGVVAASEHRLLQVKGTTRKVYFQLRLVEAFAQRMAQARVLQRCVLSCWDDLIDYCRTSMAHRDTEQFRILFLDNKNVVIADEEQARGTINHVPVYPREVVKRALELNAAALILVHNHPSGDPSPSDSDITMTDAIVRACEAIDARVHDHVIIGKNSEASFRSLGLLT
ncbi:RadC family protein [Roseobacter sp. S98]|uniref:RadC family protein n=1 Tax=Roseobacter algicola (ex Choi et al. 2025) (nom. illeg.) TaxID=3092138 RepID=UPI0035C7513E